MSQPENPQKEAENSVRIRKELIGITQYPFLYDAALALEKYLKPDTARAHKSRVKARTTALYGSEVLTSLIDLDYYSPDTDPKKMVKSSLQIARSGFLHLGNSIQENQIDQPVDTNTTSTLTILEKGRELYLFAALELLSESLVYFPKPGHSAYKEERQQEDQYLLEDAHVGLKELKGDGPRDFIQVELGVRTNISFDASRLLHIVLLETNKIADHTTQKIRKELRPYRLGLSKSRGVLDIFESTFAAMLALHNQEEI